MKNFFLKLKQVTLKDYLHIILFLLAIIPSKIMKKSHPNMWLLCEYGLEARDNAWWLFKYICENHPEQEVVYAIKPSADDSEKVNKTGKAIPYGTFRHWVYYLAADVNISTHKGGKPNAAVCFLLEVYGILKNKRVFLQHGITKDKAPVFYYDNTKMRLFICGAKPEFDFVRKYFGYPERNVVYTGFSRFDSLLDGTETEKMILVAPTWRTWLYKVSSDPYSNKISGFEESDYFKNWLGFLNSKELDSALEQTGYKMIFFPHRNMTSVFGNARTDNKNVFITDWTKTDLQVLMKKAQLMITDYSSTAMDFAYMKKPVLYYQFDYERYRAEQLEQGYFSYEDDGFGPVCYSEKELIDTIKTMLENNCAESAKYKDRCKEFFPVCDNNNCSRIFEAIKQLD